MFKMLDDTTLVSGQLTLDHLAEARRLGVTLVVNNRPDGEQAGQPTSAAIETACAEQSLGYRYIPISHGIGPEQVGAMREALALTGEGKMLAFCRSGTRSTLVWALARHADGANFAELTQAAEGAGYSLAPVAHLM
jgi:uncharacterized protein (TIGR01244 family)